MGHNPKCTSSTNLGLIATICELEHSFVFESLLVSWLWTTAVPVGYLSKGSRWLMRPRWLWQKDNSNALVTQANEYHSCCLTPGPRLARLFFNAMREVPVKKGSDHQFRSST